MGLVRNALLLVGALIAVGLYYGDKPYFDALVVYDVSCRRDVTRVLSSLPCNALAPYFPGLFTRA